MLTSPARAGLPSHVVFQGPDAVAVSYDLTLDVSEGMASLLARIPGQPDAALDSLPPGGVRTGEVVAQNLPPGSQVTIVCQHTDNKGQATYQTTIAQTTLGSSAGGALKFNYTLDGTKIGKKLSIIAGGLQVTAKGSLTLKHAAIQPFSFSDSFYVQGVITLSDVSGGPIYIDAENTFSDLANVQLTFGTQAAGSSVERASGCNFVIYSPVTLADVTGGEISVQGSLESGNSVDIHGQTGRNATPELLRVNSTHLPVSLTHVTIPDAGNILISEKGSVSFTACEFVSNAVLVSQDASTLILNDCIFKNGGGSHTLELSSSVPGGKADNCNFLNTDTQVRGGWFSFSNCRFEKALTLHASNSYFNQCVFRDQVELVATPTAFTPSTIPNIKLCSFCGARALFCNDTKSLAINESNYYGDADGPQMNKTAAFLLSGSGILGNIELTKSYERTGTQWKDPAVTPTAWLRGVIGGQVALSHAGTAQIEAYQNEDFLLSADVGVTDSQVDGVEIYLMSDGKRIDPSAPLTTLHRDLANYNGGKTKGFSTANFILNESTLGNHNYDIYADLSKITGYTKPGGVQKINTDPITVGVMALNPGSLRMRVVPVTIKLAGYAPDSPSLTNAVEVLRSVFYGMTSMKPSSLEFFPKSDYAYTGSVFAGTTPQEVFDTIAGRLEWNRSVNSLFGYAGKKDTYLFVPVASANIKALGGSYSPLNKSVIFFDETTPAAALREVARRFGVNVANQSVPFTKATAFNQSEIPALPLFGNTCLDRIRHLPENYTSFQDITGNNAASFWPLPANAAAINNGLHGLLGAPKPAAKQASHAVASGARRVLAWAVLDYVAPATGHTGGWKIRAGSLRAADITAVAGQALPPPYWSYEYRYNFEFYKKNGTAETLLNSFDIAPADINLYRTGVKQGLFLATFDVQSAFDIMRVHSIWEGNKLIFETPAAGGVTSAAVKLPAAGQTLPGSLGLRWSASGGAAPTTLGQPLQQLVLASADHGATWQVLAGMLEATTVTLNTDSLEPGTYQLRIISTDGIRSASLNVANLMVPNRPPRVSIAMPAEGAVAAAGSAWTLAADAWDLEDSLAVHSPLWKSSLQGTLGAKSKLTNVVLKPGVHTLTFSCADSKGQTGSASVQVRVVPANAVPARVWEEYR